MSRQFTAGQVAELRRRYRYDPLTGNVWNRRTGRRIKAVNGNGYIHTKVFGKYIYAHVLAWTLAYGHAPKWQIDHKNRDKTDNRLSNLRDVPAWANQLNRDFKPNRMTGYRGIRVTGSRSKEFRTNHRGKAYNFMRLDAAVAFRRVMGLPT